jgi:hypothetical protein
MSFVKILEVGQLLSPYSLNPPPAPCRFKILKNRFFSLQINFVSFKIQCSQLKAMKSDDESKHFGIGRKQNLMSDEIINL